MLKGIKMCVRQRVSITIERTLLKSLEGEARRQTRSLSGQIEYEVKKYRDGGFSK